eukprot:6839611-Karenia_brevis.AAC.1
MKRHVYALGKLAALSVQLFRNLSNNLWLTSLQQQANPQQGEGGSATLPVQPEEPPLTPSPQRAPY